jgi:hypothetical protein
VFAVRGAPPRRGGAAGRSVVTLPWWALGGVAPARRCARREWLLHLGFGRADA